MKERILLKGLTVSEFIHPEEEQAKDSLINTPACRKMMSLVSDVNLKINETITEGTYVRLGPETAARLFKILRDVCEILDYPVIPDVYICHMMSQMVKVCSSKKNYLVIADYVLDTYDDEMLYYTFGNAVSMIMAGHVKITTVAAYMTENIWLTIPRIKFKKYLHLTDATSDRGGLIACQSIAAAARCHFFELGIPPSESRKLFCTDEEAQYYIEEYLQEIHRKNRQERNLTNLAEWWINSTYIEGAANIMLEEIYDWYLDGYQKLMEKYKGCSLKV